MKLQAFTRPIQGAYREGMSFTLLIDVVDAHCAYLLSSYLSLFIHLCMHAYMYIHIDIVVAG